MVKQLLSSAEEITVNPEVWVKQHIFPKWDQNTDSVYIQKVKELATRRALPAVREMSKLTLQTGENLSEAKE